MVGYVIENDLMPPWFVAKHTGPWENDLSLTDLEKETILKWLEDGLPYKNKNIRLIPPVIQKRRVKNPDYVIKPDTPVEVPETGFIPYKRVIFSPDFKEDKWVKEIEFVTKPQVVHHIMLYYLDKKYLPEVKNKSSMFFHPEEKMVKGWAIGIDHYNRPGDQIGYKIPKNSFFLMRIHYEAIGKTIIDFETKVKLKFYLKKPKYSFVLMLLNDTNIHIPPYKNYLSRTSYKIKKDKYLKIVSSHMHLRGVKTSIFIQYPSGVTEEIFNLNPFHFNYHRGYVLKEPLFIPKDSTLVCNNYFDNSADNPINPDPSKRVKYGYSSYDEMSQCYFRFIIPNF